MELNEKNIEDFCASLGALRHACSSFLNDIYQIAKYVKFVNKDETDYWIHSPIFELVECGNVVVIKIDLKFCSNNYKTNFRRRCGRAFENVFYLDHLSIHNDRVYFYSKNLMFDKFIS